MQQRLDAALVARGLARSRKQASELIATGGVRVNGEAAKKPSQPVSDADRLDCAVDRYVSRAAHKLLGALDDSEVRVRGRALDAGASTGGFTQVLLERGCDPVYAVDVGHSQLAAHLRADSRVRVREGLNLRDLTLADVDGVPVDVLVADVSFISLRLLLHPMLGVVRDDGMALLMVKPQFEVGRGGLDDRWVVTDPALQRRAVEGVIAGAEELGWSPVWTGETHLPGTSGNREFFVVLRSTGSILPVSAAAPGH